MKKHGSKAEKKVPCLGSVSDRIPMLAGNQLGKKEVNECRLSKASHALLKTPPTEDTVAKVLSLRT